MVLYALVVILNLVLLVHTNRLHTCTHVSAHMHITAHSTLCIVIPPTRRVLPTQAMPHQRQRVARELVSCLLERLHPADPMALSQSRGDRPSHDALSQSFVHALTYQYTRAYTLHTHAQSLIDSLTHSLTHLVRSARSNEGRVAFAYEE